MTDKDGQLDSELDWRHREGDVLAQKVSVLFALFCADRDLAITLQYVKREVSLHCTEMAFNISEAQTGTRWRIFPAIFLRSRPGLSIVHSLFVSTEDGQAVTSEYETAEAFSDAIGQTVLRVSQDAPVLRNERRTSARRQEASPTLISWADQNPPLTGLIVNRSHQGLMIALTDDVPLPDMFDVLIEDHQAPCTKVWQKGKMVGARTHRTDAG